MEDLLTDGRRLITTEDPAGKSRPKRPDPRPRDETLQHSDKVEGNAYAAVHPELALTLRTSPPEVGTRPTEDGVSWREKPVSERTASVSA